MVIASLIHGVLSLYLGAVVAGARLVEPVLDAGGFLHGFTYAGNPMACAAGLAVLEEMDEQNIVENAARMGKGLCSSLSKTNRNSRASSCCLRKNDTSAASASARR